MRNIYILFPFIFMLLFTSCSEREESRLHEEEVNYEANGTVMKGFLAYDKKLEGTRPGILVVHEWWGHNEYARKRTLMLAELGYTALAVDMYGDGKQANHPDDAGKFAGEVFQNMDAAQARFAAALELLKSNEKTDSNRIAAIGYCFGGGVVLHMARFGFDLDGVVSFHGSIATQSPAQPGDVKASVLVCHGENDQMVTTEQIETFKNEMTDAGVEYKFISYPDAKHSFTNPDADKYGKKFDLPLAYNETADKKSWADMIKFFENIFDSGY